MKKLDISRVVMHSLAIASGVVVMLWGLYLIVSPFKYVLSPVLLLITFVVVELFLSAEGGQTMQGSGLTIESGNSVAEVPFVVLYVFSLVTVYLIPPIYDELWLWWPDLASAHPFNMIRLVAAFCLNFLPGYVILTTAGKRGEFKGLAKLVTSYLLSVFLISITGLFSAYVRGVIDDFFVNVFVLINSAILLVYLSHRLLRWRRRAVDLDRLPTATGRRGRRVYLELSGILVALVVVFVSLWLLWPYYQTDFFIGVSGSDMWRLHGFAQSYLDGRAFTWLEIPWWFDVYTASFAAVSGVPLANAYFSLYPLISIFILSFYVMVSGFIKDKRIAAVSTLFYAVFSGFAWLYSIYLRDIVDVPKTWMGILYDTGDKFLIQGWYPPFVVGFKHSVISIAALWWTVYAVHRLNLRSKLNFFLLSIIWALSYLFHVIDGLAFLAFLLVLLVVYIFSQGVEGKNNIRAAAVAVLVALAFITVVELSLTSHYLTYTSIYAPSRRYYYLYSPSFYGAAAASVFILILSYVRMPNSIHRFLASKYQSLKTKRPRWVNMRLGVEAIFYAYGVSLIVWVMLFASFHATQFSMGQVPWYAYPVMLGVPLLLGLVGASMFLLKSGKLDKDVKNALLFCVLASVLFFIVGDGVTVLNESFFYTGGGERGIMNWFMRPMLGIVATFALFEIFRGAFPRKPLRLRHVAKVAVLALLIAIIVITSISSTLIAEDFVSTGFAEKISEGELQALKYLHYSLPRGYVAYLSKSSGTAYIRGFANDKWWDDPGLWLGAEWQLGGVRDPEDILYTMRRTDAAYIYFNHVRDIQVLKRSLLLQLLLSALPIEFNNSEVTIYSVPPYIRAPTSDESELGIVKPSQSSGPAYDAYVLSLFTVALDGGVSYKILNGISDSGIETVSSTLLIPYDPVPHEEDPSELMNWVNQGRNLIVFNTNSFGTFESWAGLREKRMLLNCDTDSGWSVWAGRGTVTIETTQKIEGNASLRLQFGNPQSWQWSGWTYNVTRTEGKPWDLSEWDTIGTWIYSNNTSGPQWYLRLYDINGASAQFGDPQFLSKWDGKKYVPSFNGWKMITIPVKNNFGTLDLKNVTQLEISVGYQLPVDILLDDIVLYRNVTGDAYPANSIVGSQTIAIPTISVPRLDLGETTGVIANYSLDGVPVAPFAIRRDFGSGNVSFIGILPLSEFIASVVGNVNAYDTLEKIYQMLQVIPVK